MEKPVYISDCYEMVDKAKERGVQTEGIARLDSALRHQADLIGRIESEGLEVTDSPRYFESIERCDDLAWEAAVLLLRHAELEGK